MDFHLKFLDTCGNSATNQSYCFSTIRLRRTSSIVKISSNGTIELLRFSNFPEPHLNEFQVHICGELLDHLSYKVDWTKILTNTHLAYPDLPLDKFSGTDPEQDAEPFVQLIKGEIIFASHDAPADPDELVNYTVRKKALFSSLLRGPAAEWYEINIKKATT